MIINIQFTQPLFWTLSCPLHDKTFRFHINSDSFTNSVCHWPLCPLAHRAALCPISAFGWSSICGRNPSSLSEQCIAIYFWACPTCAYPLVSSKVPSSKWVSIPPEDMTYPLPSSAWWWYKCTHILEMVQGQKIFVDHLCDIFLSAFNEAI